MTETGSHAEVLKDGEYAPKLFGFMAPFEPREVGLLDSELVCELRLSETSLAPVVTYRLPDRFRRVNPERLLLCG